MALPKGIAQDDYVVVARLMFLWSENAAQRQGSAERFEKIQGNRFGYHAFGSAWAAQDRVAPRVEGADVFEGNFGLRLPILKIRTGEKVRALRMLEIGAQNGDEVFGFRKWQRLPKLRFEDAENRGVCADSEGQRQDRDGREAGIFAQHARAEADIAQEMFEPRPPPGVAGFFTEHQFIAKLPLRSVTRLILLRALFEAFLLAEYPVRAHFVGEFAVKTPAVNQHGNSAGNFT